MSPPRITIRMRLISVEQGKDRLAFGYGKIARRIMSPAFFLPDLYRADAVRISDCIFVVRDIVCFAVFGLCLILV